MRIVIGIVIGAAYLGIAGLAFRESATGWAAGHTDLGFWWAVVATLLALAGGAGVVGTWLHSRSPGREKVVTPRAVETPGPSHSGRAQGR